MSAMFQSGLRRIQHHPYLTSAIVVVLIAVFVFLFAHGGNKSQTRTVAVTRGDIAQEVIVTGKTKPKQRIDLGFEKSGSVATVYADVGDPVKRGAPLVAQDTRELRTTLDQATANKAAALAKLEALRRGPRDEDVQIARSALQKVQQDLTNIWSGVPDIIHSAYSKSDDAVRKQLDPLFINDDRTNAALSFETNSIQTTTDAASLRTTTGNELVAWNSELATITSSTSNATLEDMLLKNRTHLTRVRALLDKAMEAIVGAASSLDAPTALTYKSYVTTGRTNVDAALTSINGELESIAAEKIAVSQAEDALNLKLAGSDPQDVVAQEATVAQIDASVRAAQVQLEKSVLRSPIDGIVTRQDAKVGQVVTANTSLVALISQGDLEIDANVPEIDIGKLAVGNPVRLTLDAFPEETFSARVVKIGPAETVNDGVVNFKITAVFEKNDPKLKSGLTANLAIHTLEKKNVLLLPQIAILQEDSGAYVRRVENGQSVKTPVRLGIRNKEGKVEILSGLSEGNMVLDIGSR